MRGVACLGLGCFASLCPTLLLRGSSSSRITKSVVLDQSTCPSGILAIIPSKIGDGWEEPRSGIALPFANFYRKWVPSFQAKHIFLWGMVGPKWCAAATIFGTTIFAQLKCMYGFDIILYSLFSGLAMLYIYIIYIYIYIYIYVHLYNTYIITYYQLFGLCLKRRVSPNNKYWQKHFFF